MTAPVLTNSRNAVRLMNFDGTTFLSLDRDPNTYILNRLDLGFPRIRESSTLLSGADGELDVTRLVGGRAIICEVTVGAGLLGTGTGSIGNLMDTLRAVCHPGRRFWLVASRTDWASDRRIIARGNSFTHGAGYVRTAQMSFAAPAGIFEDVNSTSVTLNPAASGSGGMSYPKTYPFSFAPGLVSGAAIVKVGGTVSALPTIDIYGPCSGPLIRVVDTGLTLTFPTLTLGRGEFVHIDMQARTITLNNDPNQSRLDRLDFANSSGWPGFVLPAGNPQVVFSTTSSDPGCNAVLTLRLRWL